MKPQSSDRKVNSKPGRPNTGAAKKTNVQNKTQFKGKQKTQSHGKAPKPVNFVVNPQKLKHQIMQQEKQQRREAFQKQKDEKAKKFNDFQKRKIERSKILGQKTRHGQPVMKGRMEMLLNKIQYQISKESL